MEVQNVTFGGSLIRDVSALPGLLDAFVTVSRRYTNRQFKKWAKQMSEAFAHINADPIVDDEGTTWGRGELLHLGSNGKDNSKDVVMVHKFLPLARLYTVVPFEFLSVGKPLQMVPVDVVQNG